MIVQSRRSRMLSKGAKTTRTYVNAWNDISKLSGCLGQWRETGYSRAATGRAEGAFEAYRFTLVVVRARSVV